MDDRFKKLKAVRAALLELPLDAEIKLRVRDLLHLLIARVEEFEHPAFEWVDLERAAEISGQKPGRLRQFAPRWYNAQQKQRHPLIRVRRAADGSWLFHEEDCFKYRREREESAEMMREAFLDVVEQHRQFPP